MAIIGFASGLAAAAYAFTDDADTTEAAFFGKRVVDLTFGGETPVHGFLRGGNLAPGDRIPGGSLRLLSTASGDLATLDLDIGLQLTGEPKLLDALVVDRLTYGRDDLLSGADGGGDVRAGCDRDADGVLRLRELRCGIADLPAPRRSAEGGTGFLIGVRVDPAARELGTGSAGATFRFHLADKLGPDLR